MQNIFNNRTTLKSTIHRKIEDNLSFVICDNNTSNPISHQGIKIGAKVYRLVFFEKHTCNLIYYFEKGIILRFYNRGECILLQLIYPKTKTNDIHVWNSDYAKLHNSLSWNERTKELDYLNTMTYEFNEKNKRNV